MMVFWIIAAIPVSAIILFCICNLLMIVVRKIFQFTYPHVPWKDLHDHIHEIFHRGFNRTEMVITCEQNGRELCFCKTFKIGQKGMEFHLLICDIDPAKMGFQEAVKGLETMGLPCKVCRQNRNRMRIDVDCLANVDHAIAAANLILVNLVGASDTAMFSVCIKGRIANFVGHIDGETKPSDMFAMIKQDRESGLKVRSYTWIDYYSSEKRGAWKIGYAVGKIFVFLVPPRK